MHAHPRHPATEVGPPAVTAQRSADGGRAAICMHVMHGPSLRSSYWTLSISRTNSAVTAHVSIDGVVLARSRST